MPIKKVLLFDVDGVLVEPIAYKEAVKKTLEILCNAIGVENTDSLIPSGSDIAFMESRGIRNLWDMTNIVFGLILQNLFKQHGLPELDPDLPIEEQLNSIGARSVKVSCPDYLKFSQLITEADSNHPPEQTLKILNVATNASMQSVLEAFLQYTRSPNYSFGTSLYQNIILGTVEFEDTYHRPCHILCQSLLRLRDKCYLSSAYLEKLKELRKRDDLRMAVYSNRSSHAPGDIDPIPGFAPEAEIAVHSAGLSDLPLVGMGMMVWLAAMHEEQPEDLAEPNLTHALSTLLAALSGKSNSKALELAYSFARLNTANLELPDLKDQQLEVFVFEDTVSGIKPMLKLADTLRSNGYSISVTPLGIASDDEKIASLQEVCHRVFPNINSALEFLFPDEFSPELEDESAGWQTMT